MLKLLGSFTAQLYMKNDDMLQYTVQPESLYVCYGIF
jgi:hypothetical protein